MSHAVFMFHVLSRMIHCSHRISFNNFSKFIGDFNNDHDGDMCQYFSRSCKIAWGIKYTYEKFKDIIFWSARHRSNGHNFYTISSYIYIYAQLCSLTLRDITLLFLKLDNHFGFQINIKHPPHYY